MDYVIVIYSIFPGFKISLISLFPPFLREWHYVFLLSCETEEIKEHWESKEMFWIPLKCFIKVNSKWGTKEGKIKSKMTVWKN